MNTNEGIEVQSWEWTLGCNLPALDTDDVRQESSIFIFQSSIVLNNYLVAIDLPSDPPVGTDKVDVKLTFRFPKLRSKRNNILTNLGLLSRLDPNIPAPESLHKHLKTLFSIDYTKFMLALFADDCINHREYVPSSVQYKRLPNNDIELYLLGCNYNDHVVPRDTDLGILGITELYSDNEYLGDFSPWSLFDNEKAKYAARGYGIRAKA